VRTIGHVLQHLECLGIHFLQRPPSERTGWLVGPQVRERGGGRERTSACAYSPV
jgi:hypothetical protein